MKQLDPENRPSFDPPAMSKWALRASQYFLIGALLVSMGGHLALLQTVAWGNMLVEFSSKGSFSEAVDKTFDGDRHLVEKRISHAPLDSPVKS